MSGEAKPSNPVQSRSKCVKTGWGLEDLPYPEGTALVQTRWDLCVGCGVCEMACSMFHFGVLDKELSRIRIYRYLLPLPKSLQNVCSQCPAPERECQKACPVQPAVIYFDEKAQHMKVDSERCLGSSCGMCREACPAKVPILAPPEHDYPLVCDLCERDGQRRPQCVEVCPYSALEFMNPLIPQHLERVHPDDKAQLLAKNLYPLERDKIQRPPEEIWSDSNA
ncbi:MAG: 4Fe-4S dicluster domain-containing protein [Chloroflexi bacterium]|nr:4Fe-4S dicluster domain-containing protein [Chloroflexota bacterium]